MGLSKLRRTKTSRDAKDARLVPEVGSLQVKTPTQYPIFPDQSLCDETRSQIILLIHKVWPIFSMQPHFHQFNYLKQVSSTQPQLRLQKDILYGILTCNMPNSNLQFYFKSITFFIHSFKRVPYKLECEGQVA